MTEPAEELKLSEERFRQSIKNLERANLELSKTQDQLIQSEKMFAIGRLSAGVAHEINNPLAIIRLGVDVLEPKVQKIQESAKYIQLIKNAVDRASKVISDLLNFSTYREINLEPVSLDDVLDQAIGLVRNSETGKVIRIEKQSFSKTIAADAVLLEKVFFNILENAVNAIDKEGKIEVRPYQDQDDAKSIKVEITDTGCGIPDDILPKIFEPFFTTRKEQGTGLGLYAAYMILERHKGRIDVKSREGQGTTFIITIPFAQ